ncbi:MAG: Ca-activated chloride channel [Alphaproteobacteria bacterium]|jgi:Ca-activated chloride channel family protein|nr:Ca-activated chloride channel [Alphaproteobacteria bacterium]
MCKTARNIGFFKQHVWFKSPPLMRRPGASGARSLLLLVFAIAAFFAVGPRLPAIAGAAVNVPKFVTPAQMRSGALLLKGEEGRFVEAPLVGTDVDLVVSGPTARARVTQVFHNPTDGWVEAVYVYPLPDGGAVDTLKMVIGDRIVVGDIKDRKTARELYEEAKAGGRKTALMEQERPNIFTNSVANIGPGESVVVQIEYQEPVRQSGDLFSLRVPLVVAPRYNPKPIVQTVDLHADGGGYGSVVDPVPDRDRIEPPVLDPRVHAPVNPVLITVRLAAGFPLGEVTSHHHQVKVETVAPDIRVIKLAEGAVPADRDFELTWKPAPGALPSVGLFRERVLDADYLLAFVTPPLVAPAEETRPREIIFVIDNSGSMGGTSIVQAKASLIYALGRLKPSDRFNLIRFDHSMDVLFADTVPADAARVGQAKAFVGALKANGGTEMIPPMKAALTDRRDGDANMVRQVVFLTDGEIGNEQQLFDTISAMRGRSRIFMVGIGSAPNSFLMTRAAELGRGTFTHIGAVDQVEDRMRSLFDKLESPVVTNLTATFSAAGADVTPVVLPDLYRGEPVALTARVGALSGTLEVKGMIGDRPWVVTLPLAHAADGSGLSKLWARRKITDAEVARTLRSITPEEADKRILALALDHHLVTRLTSLIAIDKTPSRPDGAPLTRAEIPLNLPAGWEFDKVFGGERTRVPDGRRADLPVQPAPLDAYAAVTVSQGARQSFAAAPVQPAGAAGQPLPKTATDAQIRRIVGFMFLAASLLVLWLRRRRRADWLMQ